MNALWVGLDGLIHWNTWNGIAWKSPRFAGTGYQAKLGGQVAAVGRYPDHLDAFVVDTGGALVATWWDASKNSWALPWNLAPARTLASGAPVTVVAESPSRMEQSTA